MLSSAVLCYSNNKLISSNHGRLISNMMTRRSGLLLSYYFYSPLGIVNNSSKRSLQQQASGNSTSSIPDSGYSLQKPLDAATFIQPTNGGNSRNNQQQQQQLSLFPANNNNSCNNGGVVEDGQLKGNFGKRGGTLSHEKMGGSAVRTISSSSASSYINKKTIPSSRPFPTTKKDNISQLLTAIPVHQQTSSSKATSATGAVKTNSSEGVGAVSGGGEEGMEALEEEVTTLEVLRHSLAAKQRRSLMSSQSMNHSSRMESLVYALCLGGHNEQAYEMVRKMSGSYAFKRKIPPLASIRIFNILIKAYCKKNSVERVKELIGIVENKERKYFTQVKPDLQTIAILFHAAAGLRSNSGPEFGALASRIYGRYEKQLPPLNTVFHGSYYTAEEKAAIIKAIRDYHDPEFKPAPKLLPAVLFGDNHLLHGLNQPDPNAGNPFASIDGVTEEKLMEMFDRQMDAELRGTFTVKGLYTGIYLSANGEQSSSTELNNLTERKAAWRTSLRQEFKEAKEAALLDMKSYIRTDSIYPQLNLMDEELYVDVLYTATLRLAELPPQAGEPVQTHSVEIATQLLNRFHSEMIKKSGLLEVIRRAFRRYVRCTFAPAEDAENAAEVSAEGHRRIWIRCLAEEGCDDPDMTLHLLNWSHDEKRQIGQWMMDRILNAVKMKQLNRNGQEYEVPAFSKVDRSLEKTPDFESPHLATRVTLAKMMVGNPGRDLIFETKLTPSLVPSLPWTSMHRGGLYMTQPEMIIHTNEDYHSWAIAAVEKRVRVNPTTNASQMDPVYDALTQAGATPWKINSPILQLMFKIFNQGGDPSVKIPKVVQLNETNKAEVEEDAKSKRDVWLNDVENRKTAFEQQKKWNAFAYRLAMAVQFQDEPMFTLPNNMDFRGRIYPLPEHLSNISGDTGRGLLLFAKGERLGANGLDWLKLQCINLTAMMKQEPLEKRLEYANQILHGSIVDSAEHPLDGGKGWWKTSEEPWQTLACCMEIRNALACPNGPENYVCHLPIHQDGSCNGLQHYAALGRDSEGARMVNVSPSPRPADIYTEVAKRVEALREQERGMNPLAKRIGPGVINRKVVKQTVMTIVYGVTQAGSQKQVKKQLKSSVPSSILDAAATYVTDGIWKVVGKMFQKSTDIQKWIDGSCMLITDGCQQTVEWRTPLGLPCVQPYMSKLTIRDLTEDGRKLKTQIDIPNTMKQKNAFAPNLIHSLDASHMMLTGLHCQHAGITFASVHDCYWTTPASVSRMNEICRQQFINLHKEEILTDLSKFFVDTYITPDLKTVLTRDQVKEMHVQFEHIPPKGDLDLETVKKSVYFFS